MGGPTTVVCGGRGRLGAAVAGVFLRVGGTKGGPVATWGRGRARRCRGQSGGPRGSLGRTVSEGAEGALGRDFGEI